MEIKNCRKCKRLFNYISGQQICPTCREKLEEKFQEVKSFLFNNRDSTIKDVVENCDIAEDQVRQWIREERLKFSSGIDAGIVCEICGSTISTGRFCNKCKSSMMNDLSAAGKRPDTPKPEVKKTEHDTRMRFLNR